MQFRAELFVWRYRECFVDLGLLLSLIGLSLLDSTSFGTFGIPLVLVVAQRRVNARALRIYFGTVVIFYFIVGVLLLLGLDAIFDAMANVLNSRTGSLIQLAIGIGLFLVSFRFNGKNAGNESGSKWIPKSDDPRTMIGLGLTASVLEVATMLPYISAIGLLVTSDLGAPVQIGVLGLYCLVMIVPALIVIGAAAAFGERLWPRIERISNWVVKNSAETVGWVIGIAGFFIAGDAISRL